MKNKLFFLGLICCLMLSACVGKKTRETTLWPTVEATWVRVAQEAELGGATEAEIEAFWTALADQDATQVKLLWPALKVQAETGIANTGVSDRAKASFLERLRNFDEAIGKL